MFFSFCRNFNKKSGVYKNFTGHRCSQTHFLDVYKRQVVIQPSTTEAAITKNKNAAANKFWTPMFIKMYIRLI